MVAQLLQFKNLTGAKTKNLNFLVNRLLRFYLVPWVGIEPTLPKELDFESSASTNSATKAFRNWTANL